MALAIRRLNESGYFVFLITNQAGIRPWPLHRAARRSAACLDATRACQSRRPRRRCALCPFHPEGAVAAYRRASDWRKPAPGMILDLMRAWPVESEGSFLIGDKESDIAAASAAGIKGHLFTGGDFDALVKQCLLAAARRVELSKAQLLKCGIHSNRGGGESGHTALAVVRQVEIRLYATENVDFIKPNELRVAFTDQRASLLMRDILAMAAEDILADATWHKLLEEPEIKAKHHTQGKDWESMF